MYFFYIYLILIKITRKPSELAGLRGYHLTIFM